MRLLIGAASASAVLWSTGGAEKVASVVGPLTTGAGARRDMLLSARVPSRIACMAGATERLSSPCGGRVLGERGVEQEKRIEGTHLALEDEGADA